MRIRLLLILLPFAAGCASSSRLPDRATPAAPASFENLHATLWTATSVEYRAVSLQAYTLASLMLDRALADTSWTAATEQVDRPGFGGLPPAVVLDVDETVLDNTTFQARLIRDGEGYTGEAWGAWVAEASAVAVPGALAFTREAADRGVRVVYLTNRDADGEEATRRNLEVLGFPVDPDPDAVITQGEIPEWRASDKGPRRRHVAERYRIVLLVGDNLGDFLSDGRADLAGREALFEQYSDWWGTRWITLPNPQYGSWEAATFGHRYDLPPGDRLARKLRRIRERADS